LRLYPEKSEILLDGFCFAEHHLAVIRSFLCLDTEALFQSRVVPRFRNMERVARRKLLQLHAATELASLRIPPGSPLDALKRVRGGQYSVRVNDQGRLCCEWHEGGAHQVEIVDYN